MLQMIKFVIRELKDSDLRNGFFETLSNLSQIGSIDRDQDRAAMVLKSIKENNLSRIYVAEGEDGQIIGSITLLLEQKFIHNGGKVGHIEDVVSRKEYSGKGVGSALVQKCIDLARNEKCYKVILDCSQENILFYEKSGFRKHEVSMRYDIR
jgi:glucosamine-phosphate N-acetyltransferase